MSNKNHQIHVAPGPKGHFLIGHIPEFKKDILGTIEAARKTHGDLLRFKLGPKTAYVITSPELAQEVLVKQKDIYPKLGMNVKKPVGLQLLLGYGLLTNPDADSWLSQRRMMQPTFHRHHIATMSDKIVAAGQRMLQRWAKRYSPGAVVKVDQEMMTVTLDIINRTMFSTDVTNQAEAIRQALGTGLQFIFQRTQNPFSPPLTWPTPGNRAFKAARQTIDQVIYGIIDRRLETEERYGDLLDMLIEARDADTGEGMSREQLRDEVATIFAAGHETTANALTWTWYLLSQHPLVLQRLQEEVDLVLGDRPPTIDDLPDLPYTAATFDEALRLRHPAPLLPRRVDQDTTLNGYAIPAGSTIFVSIYSIHRHPAHWEEPEMFKPERFLTRGEEKQHRLAFMPFGAGQRMCIGNNFALIEGQLLLALMAQQVELRLVPDHPVEDEVSVTLHPRHGLNMTLHPRRDSGENLFRNIHLEEEVVNITRER